MIKQPFDVFSAAQRETARAALFAAFGPAPIGIVVPVTGGASGASAFRVEVGDRRYLLRIEGPASPLRNPHQYLHAHRRRGRNRAEDLLRRRDVPRGGDGSCRGTTAGDLPRWTPRTGASAGRNAGARAGYAAVSAN